MALGPLEFLTAPLLGSAVPRVTADRPTIHADRSLLRPTMLEALLHDVVVVVAERLPVRPVPEQLLVTPVRYLVVDHQADATRVKLEAAIHAERAGVETADGLAHSAELIARLGEIRRTGALPCCSVSALGATQAATLLPSAGC